MNEFSLKGEIALITGGGSGLGLGIAECFVAAGAHVVLIGRRADVLEKAVKKLGKAATFQTHDITALEENENLIQWVSKNVGPVSILVNNAGIHLKKSAVETTPAEFSNVLQTMSSRPLASRVRFYHK
jgi:NADP-dependent 3-hydroxy acid dehydrogenase YdfG